MNRNELLKKREEKLEDIAELKAEVKEIEEEINKLGSKYESIVILDENINEEELNNFKDFIGTITEYNGEDLGIKILAYNIKEHAKGHFYKIEFEGNEETVKNLERYYRIKEEVLKFITVKMEV